MKEVELKGVQFGYDPKKIVLEKIDQAIPNKDLVAVIGLNGGGKSTLFRLIFRTSEAFARGGVRQRTTCPNAHGSRWICSSEFQIEPSFSCKGG